MDTFYPFAMAGDTAGTHLLSLEELATSRTRKRRRVFSSVERIERDASSISITLTDPKLLDCTMCFEPLRLPVFQCENGHAACSSCCEKLANKCSSCSLPISNKRCLLFENVLESIKIPCQNMKYGCKETFNYSKKSDHDKDCIYAPCSCPMPLCNFTGSSKQLYQHYTSEHAASVTPFQFDCIFPIFLITSEKFLVLNEEKEGVIFVVSNRKSLLGHAITVSCLGPSSLEGSGYYYELTTETERSILKFQSFTKNIQCPIDNPPPTEFLLVPNAFSDTNGGCVLDICILRYGECPATQRRK